MNAVGMAPPDVFISYAREDRPLAEQLAHALSASGLQVWWDRDLTAGSEFTAVIEAQLLGATVVIVLWSAESVRSSFVRDESSRALKLGKLLPVRIEDIELPLGFGQLHTLDLLDWDGDADDETFQQLLREVRQRQPPAPGLLLTPPRPSSRWPRRSTLMTATALALVLAGTTTWYLRDQRQGEAAAQAEKQRRIDFDKSEADRHFRAGLDQQYASVPQLEKALNEYLSALEHRPAHARAHYYLGHVYAQTDKLLDASDSFKRALAATEAPLDRSQRIDAEKKVQSLARVEGEATPITRLVTSPQPAMPEEAAPRQPPRIDPPAARVALLTQAVDDLFDDNKERRINTTTSLVLDPQALSDAVPLAVKKALQVLQNGPAGLGTSASSGVVNTLVLLKSAMPGTLQVNRTEIGRLLLAAEPLGDYTAKQADKVRDLLKQASTRKPVAYIQIANEAQRPMAEALASKMRSFGYEAPAIELVGERAPATTQVRVQGKSDRSYARWVRKVTGEALNTPPVLSGLHNAKPKTDTYEIWLGRSLCAPGGLEVAGCKGAS
ncbi:toll/interleukin-1 receptor domain-containing protein [Rhodoferax ferrireducens]|uniref:toll/interleukin-1 receptor domain-containing protein n=1 Tax=Rhodoferax ferrireducens TaxID=192843 RepID=UPI000E0D372B|nr:TIR domain-containing protein [Rhodoferax ferrireducens]